MVPHVVYHVATMGNWPEVVAEQFLLLRTSGLAAALAAAGDVVRLTHVGDHLDAVLAEAARQDVPVTVVRSDPNVMHYETFAMLEIERLAKIEKTDRPVLYFHTKGVSNPGDPVKTPWRRVMGHYVLTRWRENLYHLKTRDAVGANWWNHSERHFSGNFWIATADWLRRLPDFATYHNHKRRERYSCELWIGSCTDPPCNAYSHATMDTVWHTGQFDFARVLPPAPSGPAITWVSAATPRCYGDLARLSQSFARLGPGHTLQAHYLPDPWRYTLKFDLLRQAAAGCRTSHLFWVDADCEFLTALTPLDFVDETKPLTAVRHFAFDDPREVLGAWAPHLLDRLPAPAPAEYWQSCLFGGTVGVMGDLMARVRWADHEPRDYDEYALNLEWYGLRDRIHTLPCRYAAPDSFGGMPADYHQRYEARAGGAARVSHRNREITRR